MPYFRWKSMEFVLMIGQFLPNYSFSGQILAANKDWNENTSLEISKSNDFHFL